MSSQIQITGETKVKSLTGVLVGTTGVVSSLAFDVAGGVPKLDVNGKILVAQLPNSVMEYKGVWNAATNSPTLTNGGAFNEGDVYLCNVAGTVNFGAGPIAFFVGDQAIYSGSIWQRASGATGTVTSVAVTETGDSLNITGSPITTSGTINIGFNGTNLQYVNGAGNLTTFPILTGYVTAVSGTAPVVSSGGTTPAISMAAATGSVDGYLLATDFAIFNAKQSALTFSSPLVNTSGTISIPAATTSVNGYLASADFTTFNAKQNAITLTTTGSSGVSTLVGATLNIPDYGSALTGYVTLGTTQTITGAKTFSAYTTFTSTVDITSGLTFSNSGFTLVLQPPTLSVNRTVTLPNGTGTLALTSDISYPVTSVFGRTGAVVATSGDYTTAQVTESGNLYFTDSRARLALSFVAGSGAYNSTTGVITIPTNNNQITNGSNYITLGSLSAGVGISYNNTTGVITNSAPDQVVALTASTGISVTGTYPNFTITNTSPSSGGTVTSVAALTIGTSGTDLSSTVATSTTTPVITLNVPTASATNRGALSSADWTTFNNKQSALTNPVTGTGTTNYLPKFTGASTIGDSIIQDASTYIDVAGYAFLRRGGKYLLLNPNYAGATVYADISAEAGMGLSLSANGVTKQLYIDTSGNLGLGVTPSAWSGFPAMQFTSNFSISALGTGKNAYFDGTDYRYISTNYASLFQQTSGGVFAWLQAPSGTAGNAITFTQAMTLNASGNLGLGTPSPDGSDWNGSARLLHIYQNTTNGALLKLESSNTSGILAIGNNQMQFGTVTDDTLILYTNSAERMRIWNTTGNVNIGTTPASDSGYKLDVNGTGRFSGNVTASGGASGVGFIMTNTTNSRQVTIGYTSGGAYNYIQAYDGTNFQPLVLNNTLTLASTGAATFSSSVGIGTTPASGVALDIRNNSTTTVADMRNANSAGFGAYIAAASGSNYSLRIADYLNNTLFTVLGTGAATFNSSVTATSFFESSSIKGKDIIATNPLLALDIDVIKYTRKSDESKDIRYGYSAEQIHSLMPELTDKDVTAVKYLDVHTILISQLQKEIKELKAKMN